MIKFERKQPIFFYRVIEWVSTFSGDAGGNEDFYHEEDFCGLDLLKCRTEAVKYYRERAAGFNSGEATYFLPFASPKDFVHGKNAAFSLDLFIVEYCDEEEQYEYNLSGDEAEVKEALEMEEQVLRENGFV